MSMNPRLLRPRDTAFNPKSISGLALWLDAAATDSLFTTDAGPVVAVASPLDIAGCALWLDASDPSTISDTAGAVTEWRDKTTNGRHHTAASTACPTTGTRTLNGLNVIAFDGTNNFLTGNAAALTMTRGVSGVSMFLVVKHDTTTGNHEYIDNRTGTGGARFNVFRQPGGNIILSTRRLDADTASVTQVVNLTTNPHVFTAIADFANSDHFIRSDGITAATNLSAGTDGSTSNTSSTVSNIGGTSVRMNGFFAEIIVYPTALTTAQRASVEAYLAAKWSISGVHAPATASSDPVGYWADRSGNGRHAVQSLAGSRPAISATAQNGRKILALDGTNDSLNGPAGFSLTDTHTVIAAVRPDVRKIAGLLSGSVTTTNLIYGDGSASFSGSRFGAFGTTRAVYGGGGITTGAFQVFSAVMSGGTLPADLSMFTNGAGGAVSTETAGTAPGAAMTANLLLGTTMGSQFWDGDIAEMLIWGRALTTTERQRAERYLAARWGITLAPQVANADAQDWINRVYANGGTVSSATAASVNTLCDSLDASGVRPLMYRMGIFAGSNLNAALVPLYRGPSLGGTQYGNATDTNNAFVGIGTDYAETGASGGLTGNGSTKYLNTGLTSLSLPDPAVGHLSAWGRSQSFGRSGWVSSFGASYANGAYLEFNSSAGSLITGWGREQSISSSLGTGKHFLINRSTSTSQIAYANGSSIGETAVATTMLGNSAAFAIFARNVNGSLEAFTDARLNCYSIGAALSSSDVLAYYSALNTFYTALGRA